MRDSQPNAHIKAAIDKIQREAVQDIVTQERVIGNTEPQNPDLPPDGPSAI